MKLLALAALVAASILPAATPSYAACVVCDEQGCPRLDEECASRSEYEGGCGFHTVREPFSSAEPWTGTLYVAAVVYSEANPTDNPVSATITCEIRVDGITAVTGGPYSGTTVIAGADAIQFMARNDQVVELCETVDFTSDDTPTVVDCGSGPPEPILDPVLDLLNAFFAHLVDPKVCPALAEHFPPEGDVPYPAGLGTMWDCPPYGN